MTVQQAMKNPNRVFTSPEALELSPAFTVGQKRDILIQWKDQLHQLFVADDESMLHARGELGADAECLRRVNDTLGRVATDQAADT